MSYRYISERVRSDEATLARFASHPAIDDLALISEELGRIPTESECPSIASIRQEIGSTVLISKLLRQKIDEDKRRNVEQAKKQEICVMLGTNWLNQRKFPILGSHHATVIADINAFWASYKAACEDATSLIFSLGQSSVIHAAAKEAQVGKLLGAEDFYVHATALSHLPAVLKLIHSCAELVVGKMPCDLVKFKIREKAVSLLFYKDFDASAHPELQYSIKVDLTTGHHYIRKYTETDNPPILHRKELFVLADYPDRDKFALLTEQEEAAGLLSRTDIGSKGKWEALLASSGYSIIDHQLKKL